MQLVDNSHRKHHSGDKVYAIDQFS